MPYYQGLHSLDVYLITIRLPPSFLLGILNVTVHLLYVPNSYTESDPPSLS